MKNKFSVTTKKKEGNEGFLFDNKKLDFHLIDFWRWNSSDLLNNAMRGKVAEYIIAKALCIDDGFRIEWDEYDLVYNDLKIEIKSGAYIQSWEQDKYSNIILTIKPTKDYNGSDFKRQSDIYIFAILSYKDAKTINPLELKQWDFYIIKTEVLNEKLGNQKTIGLKPLLLLNPIKTDFNNLKNEINNLKKYA